MLRSLKELVGYRVLAGDGRMGKVKDFYFSDEDWIVRYLVVHTGFWVFGRNVLISVHLLGQPEWASQHFPVNLTQKQVQASPDVDLAKPVSRVYEEKLLQYYRLPPYWGVSAPLSGRPVYVPLQLTEGEHEAAGREWEQVHLRSAEEVFGYQVYGLDGEVGSALDFMVVDENWQLRYLLVDASSLEVDKRVLVALAWITKIDVAEKVVSIDLTREAVRFSPTFDPALPVNRQDEEVLYDYYGRPKYWQGIE